MGGPMHVYRVTSLRILPYIHVVIRQPFCMGLGVNPKTFDNMFRMLEDDVGVLSRQEWLKYRPVQAVVGERFFMILNIEKIRTSMCPPFHTAKYIVLVLYCGMQ